MLPIRTKHPTCLKTGRAPPRPEAIERIGRLGDMGPQTGIRVQKRADRMGSEELAIFCGNPGTTTTVNASRSPRSSFFPLANLIPASLTPFVSIGESFLFYFLFSRYVQRHLSGSLKISHPFRPARSQSTRRAIHCTNLLIFMSPSAIALRLAH